MTKVQLRPFTTTDRLTVVEVISLPGEKASQMTRFEAFLAGHEPSEALLRQYLGTRGEWVAREFKRADQPSDFGLRIAVAAFANTDGGDVFLGVEDSGNPVGSPVDAAEISRVLQQTGAPSRVGYITNLVKVVKEPRRVALSSGSPVYWIDVVAQGILVAVVKSDGTLGLYNRPGAESDEVRGFDSIDLFRDKTRARLLVALYLEFRRIVRSIPQFYVGPNQVREDTIRPILLVLESPEWQTVATESDRGLTGNTYLGTLLSFPADAAEWERMSYAKKDSEWRMRMLTSLDTCVRSFRTYVESQGIVLPPKDERGY